ncbi:MAG: hypothetical protein AB7P02_14320 [Alphaproteobacteria bacterium]
MVGRWFLGGIVGIVGIVGLFLAATVHEPGFYAFGLGIAAAAIVYIFAMIKRVYDLADRR